MKTVKIVDILKECVHIDFIGNRNDVVNSVVSLDGKNFLKTNLLWCSDKNLEKLADINQGTIIVSRSITKHHIKPDCNYIIVENPRNSFREILTKFFVEEKAKVKSSNIIVHSSVQLGVNVFLGNNVVIEENCIIGDNCEILHNTSILSGSVLGNFVKIGCNCTIGGTGFGYEKDESGEFKLIPHLGNVFLDDYVEIGNNTCVDRAVLGSTILRENCKIDNLVHLAHGVDIGENALIIANSMIAGSVTIGKNAWIAPSVSVLNKIKIKDNAFIGMGAVVIKDVDENSVIVGNPGRIINR